LWVALAVVVYTSCVLRGALRVFNKTLLLTKKNISSQGALAQLNKVLKLYFYSEIKYN
jgi:hypothetical protein